MRKVHLAIFRQVPLGTSDEDKLEALQKEIERAAEVQKYWRNYCRNAWDVQVRAYIMEGEENAHPPYYAKGDMRKYMQTHDMAGFVPNYFMVHGGTSQGLCGQATLGGNYSVCYLSHSCNVKTAIHEFGHNLGLHHAGTWENGEWTEYGDHTNVMSSVTVARGLSSTHLVSLNVESDREILIVETSQQVFAVPIEMPGIGMHPKEWQHIIVRKVGYNDVHLTLRKSQGTLYPAGNPNTDPSILYIQERTQDNHSARYIPDMKVGMIEKLFNNVVVEYKEYKNETAKINILFDLNDVIVDSPILLGFPDKIPGVILEYGHSGFWHNNYYNGQGLFIKAIKDIYGIDRLIGFWYTFNERERSRRFYMFNTQMSDAIEEFDLITMVDGDWTDPTKAKELVVGRGQLYFYGQERGVFNFNLFGAQGRGGFEITRTAPALSNLLDGAWESTGRTGEGITCQFIDNMNMPDGSIVDFFTSIMYSYGPRPYNFTHGIIQTQRWYVINGTKQEDGNYVVTFLEAKTGEWLDPDDVGLIQVGDGILKIGDTLSLAFNINAQMVSGSYSISLHKII